MKNLVLIGGGGHCKSCIDVIEAQNEYKITGILDSKEKVGQIVSGYEIIGTDDDIEKYIAQDCSFLITIGQIKTPDVRIKLFNKIKSLNGKLATIISPFAYVSKTAHVQEGTIIMHHALLNRDSKIGKNCIINSKALIEHDCIIEDNCHIAVGAILAGGAKVEKNSFIGANSTIVQYTNIEQNSFIKAGELVK
jgi:sugar O-acyltransferase (sialic acid O-acetyltransferase NeuD family)